jgi:hypothetical protein
MFDVNDNFEMKETKMKAISLRKMVITIVIVGIGVGYVRADKLQLQEKLSRDAKIQLNDVTIAEALKKIGEKAEVKIVLSDEAVWKLPLGNMTRLSVSISGPLSDSLTEMLNVFFMRYAVGNEEITIYPRAELEHIIGRPGTKQLELLEKIYSIRMSFEDMVDPEFVMEVIGGCVGEVSILPYDIPGSIYEILMEMGTGGETLPITLAVLLEHVGDMQNKPRWYLSGMDFPNQVPVIRVVSEQAFREAKLDQVVDISFKYESADVIIQRLAGWTGMELVVRKGDPSWLEEIIAVNMQNIKLKQALRNIVNSVDGEISFHVRDNYIRIEGPRRPPKIAVPAKTKSSGGAGEGYVGKISIPMDGGKYFIEFMLRESDLTEELKKLREEKIKEIFKKVGKAGDKAPEIAAHPQSYSILN